MTQMDPLTRTVQLCAHAFGITVDDLLGDTGTCLRAAAAAYESAPVRTRGAGGQEDLGAPGFGPVTFRA